VKLCDINRPGLFGTQCGYQMMKKVFTCYLSSGWASTQCWGR